MEYSVDSEDGNGRRGVPLWQDTDVCAALEFTDIGYLCRHHADMLALELFRFDAAGDVNWIDWARVASDDGVHDAFVSMLVRHTSTSNTNLTGFLKSMECAARFTSYDDPMQRALWSRMEGKIWTERDSASQN